MTFQSRPLDLQLLVDQGPRFLLDGIDQRYTNAYFDVISLKLAKQLYVLLEALRPDSKARWMEELGASFDFWIIARFWFMVPFAHAENAPDLELQSALAEESRLAVEGFIGITYPYRATRDGLDNAFSRILRN